MRILDLADLPHRPIEAHGSRGFSVGAFGLGADTHLVAVSLAPGGVIGPHPAIGRQLLVVLHVLGATLTVVACASLWASTREPDPDPTAGESTADRVLAGAS